MGSIPDPTLSTQASSSGMRAGINTELVRLLTKVVEDLGLDWSPPEEPASNRLNEWFLQGRRQAPQQRPAPFLPELHAELTKSWKEPFSARLKSSVSSTLSVVDAAQEKGYHHLPLIEEAVSTHLCPPSAGWQPKAVHPSKACRTTSALTGHAYAATGSSCISTTYHGGTSSFSGQPSLHYGLGGPGP